MSSLRQAVMDFAAKNHLVPASISGDRRTRCDRRTSDRRVVHPLGSREARLRLAAQAAGLGTYDLDCVTGDGCWSPEIRAMAGLPPDNVPLSTEQVESLIHPDDRLHFQEKLWASLRPEGSGEFEDEHRLLRPDGSVCWVRTKGRTTFFDRGGIRCPLASTGVVMDIGTSRVPSREQEELEKIVEAAIDSIITVDDEQRITRFNPSAARMFRCSAEEAIGSGLERFIPERYRAAHAEHVRRFAEGQTAAAHSFNSPGRFTGLRANGEEFPFEATVTRVTVDGQNRMTAFVRDVTDRMKAEDALRASKEDLELAIRGANIGIWRSLSISADDRWHGAIEWSGRTSELFGLPPNSQATIEQIHALVHPDDVDVINAETHRAIAMGDEYHAEYRVIWPDGSLHWLESVGRLLYDENRKATGMHGVTFDITRRKHAEEALQHSKEELETRVEERTAELMRAKEALERSNLELQQFAFIAAHDLQTPLRSISGFAQLLQKDYRGRLDPQADLWLSQLIRSALRLHELIRDLLTYSRVESRGSTFQPVDFNQLFDDVVATMEVPIREADAQVTRDDLPAVMGDRTQLAQILQNLIDNAIKYRGSEQPRIHVSAARSDQEWIISVHDNGIGMAEKHLNYIFDIFRRLHTQEEYPGTGIGLAICRRVVYRHGGRIWVESTPGQGSTFYFSLPDRDKPAA